MTFPTGELLQRGTGTRQPFFNRLNNGTRVIKPIFSQYQHDVPAKREAAGGEARRVQQVAVLVIALGVNLDAQSILLLAESAHGKIAAKPGSAHVTINFVAAVA